MYLFYKIILVYVYVCNKVDVKNVWMIWFKCVWFIDGIVFWFNRGDNELLVKNKLKCFYMIFWLLIVNF